jgi:AraC-like DNA-binding protein
MNIRICQTHIIGPQCRERFLPLLEGGPLVRLGVTLAGVSDLKGEYCMSRPQTSFILLLGTLSGRARLTTEKGVQELKAGDLLISPSGKAHRYELIHGRPWRIVWFHIKNPHICEESDIDVRSADHLPKLVTEMDDLIRESTIKAVMETEARRAKEGYLSVLIQRLILTDENSQRHRYEMNFSQLWRQVTDRLGNQWTLNRLAEIAGYSAGHLNRICRQYYGRPAMKQLAFLRLEYAARLLLQGSMKIRTVAKMCGYENEFAFSVAFKRQFGVSPAEYRNPDHGRESQDQDRVK